MKSIIEEASSISKAIENGWIKAGKPKEFSVKIFEEPVKNFFGLTVKSAKIGIFFQELKSKAQNIKEDYSEGISLEINKEVKKIFGVDKGINKARATQQIWSQQMVNTVNNWLNEIFENLVNKKIDFSIIPNSFKLNINISSAIFDDKNKEKKLFSNLAILIMQMLKKQYRRPFKGYRIAFINNV